MWVYELAVSTQPVVAIILLARIWYGTPPGGYTCLCRQISPAILLRPKKSSDSLEECLSWISLTFRTNSGKWIKHINKIIKTPGKKGLSWCSQTLHSWFMRPGHGILMTAKSGHGPLLLQSLSSLNLLARFMRSQIIWTFFHHQPLAMCSPDSILIHILSVIQTQIILISRSLLFSVWYTLSSTSCLTFTHSLCVTLHVIFSE